MKFKTTRKEMLNGSPYIIKIPYCQLQELLYHEPAIAYSAGSYGWNFDVYLTHRPNTYLVTGYRPCGKIEPSYELLQQYEKLAKNLDFKDRNELLKKFVNEVVEDYQAKRNQGGQKNVR